MVTLAGEGEQLDFSFTTEMSVHSPVHDPMTFQYDAYDLCDRLSHRYNTTIMLKAK